MTPIQKTSKKMTPIQAIEETLKNMTEKKGKRSHMQIEETVEKTEKINLELDKHVFNLSKRPRIKQPTAGGNGDESLENGQIVKSPSDYRNKPDKPDESDETDETDETDKSGKPDEPDETYKPDDPTSPSSPSKLRLRF